MGTELSDATSRASGSGAASYTVGDLLAEPELGLELVAGREEALAHAVVGAHAIEGVDPSRHLVRDWVMLTNGLNVAPGTDERAVVAQLEAGGVAALGFGADV